MTGVTLLKYPAAERPHQLALLGRWFVFLPHSS
jgi:hypothetical protein